MSKLNKVAAVMMVASFLLLASPASAVTVDELLAQIALLQSQLQALQVSPAPVAVSSCSFADVSAASLTVGSRGSGVSDLQSFLKAQGASIYPSGLVTGYFGSLTKAGVAAFQAANGVSPAVGYFGPLTKAKVRSMCSVSPASPTPSGSVSASPTPSGVATGLSVALASDTAPAQTIVKSAARVPFTKVVFTAVGGQAVVDSITVQRVGISADANFSSIVLLDQNGNQVGTTKTLGSTHQVVINNDLTIPAGQSVAYTLAGNMASSLNAAEVAALSLVSVVTKDSVPVNGSLPITGNSMTLNTSLSIGGITVTAGGLNPSASTQKVGTTAYTLSSIRLAASSPEDVQVSKIRWYQNGTAADTDVTNLKLMSAGAQVGSTIANPTDKYVTFDFSSAPITITKGTNKEFSLAGNIVNGSSRTVEFDIYDEIDVVAKGVTYGYFITPSYPQASQPYFSNSSNKTTIAVGSFSVSKANLASTYAAAGGTQVAIGAFQFVVQGEPIQVTRFGMSFAFSGALYSEVTSVTLYDSAGKVVAGPVDSSVTATYPDSTATSTDTWTIPVGTSSYTVKANLASTMSSTDTIQVKIDTPSATMTTKGTQTNMTVTSDTTSDISGDTVTVRAGALNVSTSATPAAQTYIQGGTQKTLANFVLDGTGSGEDVRVTSIAVAEHVSAAAVYARIANLTLYDGSTALSPIVQPSGTATVATSTFNLTSPIVVAKGTSKTVTLKGDVVGSSGTIRFGLTDRTASSSNASVVATGASTATAIAPAVTASDGQLMTLGSTGTVVLSTDASSPASKYIAAGATGVSVGEIRVTATSDSAQLSNIEIVVTDTHGSNVYNDIAKAYLYDGSTKVAEMTPTSSHLYFALADNALVVPSGYTGKSVTVKLDMNSVGAGETGVSGDALTLSVAEDGYTFKGVGSGTNVAVGDASGTFSGSALYFARTFPTITPRVALSSTTLASGTMDLYKFSVSAPSYGDVALAKMAFIVSTYTPNQSTYTGASTTVSSFNVYDDAGNALFLTATSGRAYVDYTAGSTDGTKMLVNAAVFTGSNFSGAGSNIYIIAKGSTKTFTLKGSVTNPQTGSNVTSILVGDSAMAGTYPAPAFAEGINGDSSEVNLTSGPLNAFIWSDLWDGAANLTTLAGNRWFNGYRLSSLTASDTGTVLSK